MNFQTDPVFLPLRVLVINPLSEASQLVITKILSGRVFGRDQLIDLILLVYANERTAAEDLNLELHCCGFVCMNTLTVSTDLPFIEDADVFCFITNFHNPNSVDFNDIDNEQFDVLYLIIKVANSLAKHKIVAEEKKDDEKVRKKKVVEEEVKPRKPIIMTDGIVTMNVLRYLTKGSLPDEIFFCPTALPGVAKVLLGEQLRVQANDINVVLVWGADDRVFHVEVAKPILIDEVVEIESHCDWEMMGRETLQSVGLDYSQFNKSWLRKDFIVKVQAAMARNPYGSIYIAADFARTLEIIWQTRAPSAKEGLTVCASAGVISDGTLDTIKGMAYVLPLVFTKDTWRIDTTYQELLHLQQEIKRINEEVKKNRDKLYPYCKRFLEENVMNLAFIPPGTDSIGTALSHSK